MTRYPSFVLWTIALVYVATGSIFLVDLHNLFAAIGLTVPEGSPTTELRAVYAGLEIGLGLFLAVCAHRGGADRTLGLLAGFLTLAGLALTRATGMLVDGPQVAMMQRLLTLESIGVVFAFSGMAAQAKLHSRRP